MYEGGKPTAVKTLGTQIAAIYEGKVVADELDAAAAAVTAA